MAAWSRRTAAGALACLASIAWSQGYPSKPIRIIVPGPVGGPSDIPARVTGQHLQPVLGQPFLVENLPGANGILGAQAFAKAPADGYTLCVCNSQVAVTNALFYSKLSYDPQTLFAPVMLYGFINSSVVAHPSAGIAGIRELFARVKEKPGSVTWGTYGAASNSNLYVEWARKARGLSFLSVPYKTSAQAQQALVAGEIDIATLGTFAAAQLSRAGKLRVLATAGMKRSAYLPEVPTLNEEGVEANVLTWIALFSRAGTPREIVQRLNTELAKLYLDAGFRQQLLTPASLEADDPAGKSPEAFAAFIEKDRVASAQLAKITGVRLD